MASVTYRTYVRTLGAALLAFAGMHVALAQTSGAKGDSLRPYELPAVTVSAAGLRMGPETVPLRLRVATRQDLDEVNGSTLGEALRIAPGLVIREYGGGGGMQLASFRGLAAEQTLILVDGIPVNDPQTGLLDLRMLPLSEASSIEWARGGMSALYGSNASGGVINVRTDHLSPEGSAELGGSVGAYGLSSSRASVHLPFGSVSFVANIGRERANGSYPVRRADGSELLRTNADYLSDHAFLRSDWRPAEGPSLSFAFGASRFDRGVPGPLLAGTVQGDGRQSDALYLLRGTVSSAEISSIPWWITGSLRRSEESYRDTTGVFRGENHYRMTVATLSPSLTYAAASWARLETGIDLDVASARGNALSGDLWRRRGAVRASAEVRLIDEEGEDLLTFVPAFRGEATSGLPAAWTPHVGLRSSIKSDRLQIVLHGSVGRNYRIPTMNELHYAGAGGVGNPSLSPEVALASECGGSIRWDGAGLWRAELNGFWISSRDRIVWEPSTSPFIWSPVNVSRSRSLGFEAELRWEALDRAVTIEANYAWLDATDRSGSPLENPDYGRQLPYVPLETAGASFLWRLPLEGRVWKRLSMRLEDRFTGRRFAAGGEQLPLAAEHVLAGNLAVDAAILGGTVRIKYELENIADASWEEIPGYPMAPRHSVLSFTFARTFHDEN